MPLLYEINTRCWLRDLSSRCESEVTLGNVPEFEFQFWASAGFTHIWLMGVWPSGPKSRRSAQLHIANAIRAGELPPVDPDDVVGSPYAVSAYSVSPDFGAAGELSAFRHRLNSHGIRLILDFVPNHLGIDHPWIEQRPQLFVGTSSERPGFFRPGTPQGSRWIAHGKDPFFPAWCDTAQLDYRSDETRQTMISLLHTIAAQCDGVRCDMAMLLLNDVFNETWVAFQIGQENSAMHSEFWSEAIAAIKEENARFEFIAEAYWGREEQLQQLGFDFTYNKDLYDALVGGNSAAAVKLVAETPPQMLERGVHFLENHDERRIAGTLPLAMHKLAALLTFSLPGMRLVHEGQLSGARIRVPVQLGRRPEEAPDPVIGGFYDALLAAIRSAGVGIGIFSILRPSTNRLDERSSDCAMALLWQRPGRLALTVLNLGDEPTRLRVDLPEDGLAAEDLLRLEPKIAFELAGKQLVFDLPAKSGTLLGLWRSCISVVRNSSLFHTAPH
ncbi:MAG TPA: alpha-amylase family glycosyl hydrolase [Verrucomicrobiae bacterium]|nr:alpha-amylase family glycosyl hydrolase [Verrucomicrobiae bacterium]